MKGTCANVPPPTPQEDQYMSCNLQLIILRPAVAVLSFYIKGEREKREDGKCSFK